ncbi:MAG TPA: alkaline phosphatase family protein [bacterium]|nr:alkaline phosphatase family protein [bacterium]
MKRVVAVILDGMRRDLVTEAHTPCLGAFRARAEHFAAHRSVFPSATRVASASFATGCYPDRHGLQGNSLALLEDGVLVRHDAGAPDFLQHKRRVTGTSLAVPTLAERVKDHGGAITFSNASPGAAYAHDPDGHGFLYNRAGSFGPGRVPVPTCDELHTTPDLAGDRIMTHRFVADVLGNRRPALAVLWLHEPDHIQHGVPLGSPQHLDGLRQADTHAGLVIEAVDRLRDAGEDVLLLIGSDHGHQTVVGVVDVEAELIEAGLKAGGASGDVVSVSSGTSALVYVHPDCSRRLPALREFLGECDWAARVVPPEELQEVGQAPQHGLAFAVSMRAEDRANEYGVPGSSLEALPADGKPAHLGFGQHGGLGIYEQSPFLMVEGAGFKRGAANLEPSSVVDIAPTVLRHLDLPAAGTDGRALQHTTCDNGRARGRGDTANVDS